MSELGIDVVLLAQHCKLFLVEMAFCREKEEAKRYEFLYHILSLDLGENIRKKQYDLTM